MPGKQTKLSFLPRAKFPEVPSQGAVINVDAGEEVPVAATSTAPVPNVRSKERRSFSDDMKKEIVEVVVFPVG
jgi:hypothetical protein